MSEQEFSDCLNILGEDIVSKIMGMNDVQICRLNLLVNTLIKEKLQKKIQFNEYE
jgi:hypothetical protein